MGEPTFTPRQHAEFMECGRLLIRNGRAWLPLSDAEVEHGARCVVRDPVYRAEVGRTAYMHAYEIGDYVLVAAISEAWGRLDEICSPFGGTSAPPEPVEDQQ